MFYLVVRVIVIAVCCTAAGLSAMHLLQVQRYQTSALRKELRRHNILFTPEVLVAAAATAINWYMPILLSMAIQKEEARETLCNWLMLGVFILIAGVMALQKSRMPQRKPFSCTRRIVRLMVCVFILHLLIATGLTLLTLSPYLLFAGVDYLVLLAAAIMRPIEDKLNARYYATAAKKLAAHKKLIRIGITGSYGKTETKLILKTILSEKYRVLSTPPSFSSAMGISRVVNEQLKSAHQVFIAEMGAQQKGEIREMAKLVRPNYGAITCVGAAHLDSFGSIETAAQTKFELIHSLKEGGIAFFGSDCSYGDRLYGLCKTEKYRACIGNEVENFMRAEHVETSVKGSHFELICADGGHAWVQAKLLGRYSVQNITLAAAIARKLGLSMEEIARGIEKIRPIRRHLQLIPGEITVIDDSENMLPDAANEALQVLRHFPGRRILVTAGLTGLDMDSTDKNFAFGTQIPECADYVILIGPEDTRAVMRGLMSKKFPKSAVRMVRDEYDAVKIVHEIATTGDTVLYEGVYPDDDDEE